MKKLRPREGPVKKLRPCEDERPARAVRPGKGASGERAPSAARKERLGRLAFNFC